MKRVDYLVNEQEQCCTNSAKLYKINLVRIAFLLGIVFNALICVSQVATKPSGSGTQQDPYLIASLDNLYWLTQDTTVWGCYFEQTNTIDASSTKTWDNGEGFSPIGYEPSSANKRHFKGTYNGNGFEIAGLYINRSLKIYIGLFGYTENAHIMNLGLKDIDICGGSNVGGLVGSNVRSTIKKCYCTGKLRGTADNALTGGLIGYNYMSSVSCCYSTDSVEAVSDAVGGFIGKNDHSDVRNCYSTGFVQNWSANIGGFIGENVGSTVQKCYSMGDVKAKNIAGGFIGYNEASDLVDCFCRGNVTLNPYSYTYSGGFVGKAYRSGILTNCYSTGKVTGVTTVGAFIGENISDTVVNCFFDTEMSDLTNGIGTDALSQTVNAKNTSAMKQQNTFVDWNFDTTWSISATVNDGYPYLKSECFANTANRINLQQESKIVVRQVDNYIIVSGIEGSARIEIIDINGRVLLTKKVLNETDIEIEPSIARHGLYIISVTSSTACFQSKWVK